MRKYLFGECPKGTLYCIYSHSIPNIIFGILPMVQSAWYFPVALFTFLLYGTVGVGFSSGPVYRLLYGISQRGYCQWLCIPVILWYQSAWLLPVALYTCYPLPGR